VLGILAAVAIPRMAATRDDATITKGIAEVASIRSGIVTERQARLIVGSSGFIPLGTGTYKLNGVTYNQLNNGGLFGGVLTYPITANAGNNGWNSASQALGVFTYSVAGSSNIFTYTPADGKFLCKSGNECSKLVP
jgi:general secretion pathway protein G